MFYTFIIMSLQVVRGGRTCHSMHHTVPSYHDVVRTTQTIHAHRDAIIPCEHASMRALSCLQVVVSVAVGLTLWANQGPVPALAHFQVCVILFIQVRRNWRWPNTG